MQVTKCAMLLPKNAREAFGGRAEEFDDDCRVATRGRFRHVQ